MGKRISDTAMDACLQVVANSIEQHLLTDEPQDLADVAAMSLAVVSMNPSNFGIGDGDVSGRKVQIAQVGPAVAASTGLATHVGLISDTQVIHVTTCPPAGIVAGNAYFFGTHKHEIADI